jgi:3'-phosphoadenosine 5'-phosphosulfate sulfotransferase (PAPS reductase)/FAD synthetase
LVTIDWSKYRFPESVWFSLDTRSKRTKFFKENGIQYSRGEVPRCALCNHVYFNCKCDDPEFQRKKRYWQEQISKPFEEKLDKAVKLVSIHINDIKEKHLKIYLAYSGGIDSECCLQLYKEPIKEKLIDVIVGNTLTELPDTYKRLYQAEKELGIKFKWATPKCGVTFETNAIEYGLPLYPRNNIINIDSKQTLEQIDTASEINKKPTKMCCHNLKENPQALLTNSYDGNILGLRATESQARGMAVKHGLNIDRDCYFGTVAEWDIRPIAWWTRKDEWKFQKLREFNYNGIYDKTNIHQIGKYKTSTGRVIDIRSGCAYCPQGIHQGYLEWLHEYYPKHFKMLVKIYNNVALKSDNKIDFNKVLEIKKVKDPRSPEEIEESLLPTLS